MNLVFMLEEPSAKSVLDIILPMLLPPEVTFQTIPHRGKDDLRRSLPRKLRSWLAPDTHFVVLHDQDSNSCETLKEDLQTICQQTGRYDVIVRIACRELEAWYFGDLEAVERAFPGNRLQQLAEKREYRDPDNIVKPSSALERLVPGFQKGFASKTIPHHMHMERNRSRSFQVFVEAVRRLAGAES
jgi:hypothetical protein